MTKQHGSEHSTKSGGTRSEQSAPRRMPLKEYQKENQKAEKDSLKVPTCSRMWKDLVKVKEMARVVP